MGFKLDAHISYESLRFPKQGSQIRQRAEDRIRELRADIEMRQGRIEKILKERGQQGETLAVLEQMAEAMQHGGGYSNAGLGVGDQAGIQKELGKIIGHRRQIETLEQVARNLPADQTFDLSFAELEFFDF